MIVATKPKHKQGREFLLASHAARKAATKKSMNAKPVINEYKLLAAICRESFADFVKEFWDQIVPEKLKWNWHMQVICDEMQKVAERVFKGQPKEYDLIINVPPGTSKSTIVSVMFPVWVWTRMRSARSLCGSYAYPLAMNLSRYSRTLVKSDLFRKCFPEVQVQEDQDSKGYFLLTDGGYRYSFGINGSVTGYHGHFIIIDDPLDPNRSVSALELNSANNWIRETLSSRKVDKSIAVTIYVMQRLTQNDPTGDRLSNKKAGPVRHICLPAKISEKVNPPELAKFYVDGFLDPVRLNQKVLDEAWGQLLDYGYACQFDQNPIPRGGGLFKTDKIRKIPVHELPLRNMKIIRYWDKAGTSKGGAFTVGAKLGMTFDPKDRLHLPTYYLIDIKRGQWEARTREMTMRSTAETDGRHVRVWIEQEPGSAGQDSVQASIRMLHGYSARADKVSGDKELRADTFAAQVNAGNVLMVEGDWNEVWLEEARFFPYSKYKDQIDATSGAFNQLAKPRRRIGAF